MKKYIFILSVFFVTAFFSQENIKTINISGKVTDKKTNQPLEFATITLINSTTNSLVTGGISNEKGVYTIKTVPGIYNIKIEFIGLKTHVLENKELLTDQALATVLLEEDAKLLETIEVKTEKTIIEHRLDKKVFVVGNDMITKGGTANDILNNVPSVSVNSGGVVNLRGNSGVRILINGKPSVLTANNGLEQIPAENIEKIEVITNPSSQYASQGTAGIINIVLKKNKANGFGSSVQLTGGQPANHAIGYNVNYKNKAFNLFSDLRYSYRDHFAKQSNVRTNYISGIPDSYLLGNVYSSRNNKTFNLYFGGDYYFNDKNALTLSYYHRNNTSDNTVDYSFNYLDKYFNSQRLVLATEHYKEPQKSNQIELNYIKTFAKEGKKFTLNVQYDFWNDDENELIVEQEKFPVELPVRTLKSHDIESSKDFILKSDFTLPIKTNSKIDMGLQSEIRNINSDYNVFDDAVLIDSLNNLLRYNEQITGAYLQFGSQVKKLQYQLGLRVEDSRTGSKDRLDQFNIQKKYFNFFPTAHLTYAFFKSFDMQLSYSRRINRPSFWQLNPFGGIADRRNMRMGNPDLNPMYTDSYELGTLFKWKKITINPGAYYQLSTNIFESQRTNGSNGFLVERSINAGTEGRMGAELNISYSPLKWLTLSGEANYYSFAQKGVFTVSGNAITSRLNLRFKFASWNAQANFNYIGPRKSGQVDAKAEYWMHAGIGKDIWKEKATITFKTDNVFNSIISRGKVSGADYNLNYRSQNIGPRFFATFTYRLNRKKNEKERRPE